MWGKEENVQLDGTPQKEFNLEPHSEHVYREHILIRVRMMKKGRGDKEVTVRLRVKRDTVYRESCRFFPEVRGDGVFRKYKGTRKKNKGIFVR